MSADDFSATEVFSSVDVAGDSRIQLRTRDDGSVEVVLYECPPAGAVVGHSFRATPKGIADATALATALLDWAATARDKTNPKSEPAPAGGNT